MIIEDRVTDRDALARVKRGIRDLMMDFPLCGLSYLGEAVEVREDLSITTMATDGRGVYYGPRWIHKSDDHGVKFDLLHEWLHIFFNHVARCGDRDGKIWNEACDMVVVRECCRILSKGGIVVQPPSDGVQPAKWAEAMSAEQIYDNLIKNPVTRPPPPPGGGEHQTSTDFLYDRAEEKSEGSVGAEEEFKRKFSEELAQAAMVQQQVRGQTVSEMFGGVLGARLEEVLRSYIPWSRLLRGDLIGEMGQTFPSYAPPNRKHYSKLILPTMRSLTERKLMIGVDVSASVGQRLFKEFKSNVMPAALRAKTTIVVTFDAIVREVVRTHQPRKVLDQVKFLTGAHGYTSVRGLYDIVDKEKPTALVIFTDAHIRMPDRPYPKTLWVVPQNAPTLPWGRTYKMEVSW